MSMSCMKYFVVITVVGGCTIWAAANADAYGEEMRADSAANYRNLTPKEIEDIVLHVGRLPPQKYDITVAVEFMLPTLSETEIRKSVNAIYTATDEFSSHNKNPQELTKEREREISRLLLEQERPRRIIQRTRADGNLYRLDQTILKEGQEADPSSIFLQTFANCGDIEKGSFESFRYDRQTGVASRDLRKERRVVRTMHWAAGTLGIPLIVALRGALGIRGFSENAVPEQLSLSRFSKGQDPNIKIVVEDINNGETKRRRFRVTIPKLGNALVSTFETRSDAFEPVLRLDSIDYKSGAIRHSCEVISLDSSGQIKSWQDRDITSKTGGDNIHKYILLSHSINKPIPDDTFDFVPPPGMSIVDYRSGKAVITEADGRVHTAGAGLIPTAKSDTWKYWLLAVQAAIVIAIVSVTRALTYRRHQVKE